MLKILCYIESRGGFEFIATSESGRLATRVQDPFVGIAEIQDLERLMQEKLDNADPKPEGLAELVESIHQYNETVPPYERLRYLKEVTPAIAQKVNIARAQCDARAYQRGQQNMNTVIDMQINPAEEKKDGE
jgi:hypothetical protein